LRDRKEANSGSVSRWRGSRGSSAAKNRDAYFSGALSRRVAADITAALASPEAWARWCADVGIDLGSDPLTDSLADDDTFATMIADLIAAAFLADTETGRQPTANGTYRPWRSDAERDAIAAERYAVIRREQVRR
jgi:hypothetical protein